VIRAQRAYSAWLQAGCWYADIRVNLASGEIYSGFGGVIWWREPKLWFQHLINISGTLSDQDVGDIALTRFSRAYTLSRCGNRQWQTLHSNTPRENCWQPTVGLARSEWLLRKVVAPA